MLARMVRHSLVGYGAGAGSSRLAVVDTRNSLRVDARQHPVVVSLALEDEANLPPP